MPSALKNIAVFTSGGDAPGMNAAIRAVVRTAIHENIKVFGIYRGYQGMIHDAFKPMDSFSVANIIQRGGTILKSARSEEFRTAEGRALAIQNLRKHSIDAIVAIGGNGTYAGAQILGEESGLPIIGLPGTIDNDIYGTDFTIGYDTALNNAVNAIDKIRDTADAHERVFFVEVMGRDSGFIGLNVGMAVGAESILIPEIYDDKEKLLEYFESKNTRQKLFSIVIVTEGNKEGNALELADEVRANFPYLDIRVSILGHIQRGGSPTAGDRLLASKLGYEAVMQLKHGKRGMALGYRNGVLSQTPFPDAIQQYDHLDKNLWKVARVLSL